jgi:two-component system NtrC family sensor kinase
LKESLSHSKGVKALILVFALAMATLGALNFAAQWNAKPVTDGVKWIFLRGVVISDLVPQDSAGAIAGIQKGDQLVAINFHKIRIPQDVGAFTAREMEAGRPLQYDLVRGSESFVALVAPKVRTNSFYFYLASVGFIILAIGVFAFLKSHSRSFALHFFFLCLAFFGAYVFSFTRKLDTLDWIFFWGDEVFLLLLPPLFLHFAFYFPGQRQWISRDRLFLLYLPSVIFITARILFTLFYFLQPQSPYVASIEGYLAFENFEILYLFLGLFAGTLVLFYSYAKSEDIIQRKQLKLVLAGIVAGFGPFSILWLFSLVVRVPNQALEAALMPQILIPLSLTYALFKYRLMDVDIIIKRGMIYTLTTLVLFGMYLMLTVSAVKFLMPEATRFTTVVIASLTTLLAALLFQPLRDRVRSFVDRVYYKDSYDYRRTLVQFYREMTSSSDIDQLSGSLLKHVFTTFKIERAELFLKTGLNRFESSTNPDKAMNPGSGFLTALSTDPFVFVDSHFNLDAELLEDEKILRELNLNYFIPCRFKHNIVAIIAVSKKEKGDYLSSEDLDLLVTLANQLAIVIENHRLFFTLKNKADELERLKNFNENILLSLNVGICTLDENGKVVACNQSMESFLGTNRVLILGRKLEEIFPPEIVDRYKNYNLKSPRKKLEGARFYKTLAENFKGQDSVMNLSFVPLINESDMEYGTILILDDVTHQAKLEEQLTQNEKLSALGLLAAGVAHEVNTPLTGISSYTQMLEHQFNSRPETREILQKIEQQTFRASKIINTLLDLSREQPAEVEQIDINGLLHETLLLLKPHFKDLPIEIVQEFDSSNPAVSGNEGKLQQVFTNLFLNARDAMQQGGRLLVRTETDGGQVLINIVDTGVGMDEKTLKRIYEPFFSKKAFKGTGLGLAITYTIIQEHRGSIDVFSEEGKGTHFQIKLPMKREVHEQSRAYSGD